MIYLSREMVEEEEEEEDGIRCKASDPMWPMCVKLVGAEITFERRNSELVQTNMLVVTNSRLTSITAQNNVRFP